MAGMSMNQIIATQSARRTSRPRPLPGRAENPFQPRRTPNPTPQRAGKTSTRASNPGCGNKASAQNPSKSRSTNPIAGRYGGWWGGWPGMGAWGWGYPYGRYVLPPVVAISTSPVPVTSTRLVRPHPSNVLAAAAPYAYPSWGWGGYGGYGYGSPYGGYGYGGYGRPTYGVASVS